VVFHEILDRNPISAVRLNPDLPAKLAEVINKCLERDRNLRCQHAGDIKTDLKRLERDTDSGTTLSVGAQEFLEANNCACQKFSLTHVNP
jgi:hypothetical protein